MVLTLHSISRELALSSFPAHTAYGSSCIYSLVDTDAYRRGPRIAIFDAHIGHHNWRGCPLCSALDTLPWCSESEPYRLCQFYLCLDGTKIKTTTANNNNNNMWTLVFRVKSWCRHVSYLFGKCSECLANVLIRASRLQSQYLIVVRRASRVNKSPRMPVTHHNEFIHYSHALERKCMNQQWNIYRIRWLYELPKHNVFNFPNLNIICIA